MQQHTIKRSLASTRTSCGPWPPPVLRRGASRRLPLTPLAAGKGNAPDQPSTSSNTGSVDASSLASSPVTVVEATVLEPGAAPADAAEVSSSGSVGAGYLRHPDFPEPSADLNRAAGLQYGALWLVFAGLGGAVAVASLRAPQVLLPASAAADPWAGALLGCLAATYLRAAGVFLHLKGAADNGELLCWRHQRLALAAAVYGIVAAASQALGAASLPLAGLQLALAVGTAAVVTNVARSVWAVRPFVSAVSELAQGGLFSGLARAAVEAVSTVAGVLLLATTAMSLYGFVAIVPAPAPALPMALGAWPGHEAVLGPAASGLRRLVGCGLLLLAAQAHGLLDYAGTVRQVPRLADLDNFKRFMTEHLARTRDPLAKYYLPAPETYGILNLTFVAAAVLQAVFVLRAPGMGVNVNWDGALWGPMYGTWALVLLYGVVALSSFDWGSAVDVVLRLVGWGASMVLSFFNTFVWKFEWAEKTRRA